MTALAIAILLMAILTLIFLGVTLLTRSLRRAAKQSAEETIEAVAKVEEKAQEVVKAEQAVKALANAALQEKFAYRLERVKSCLRIDSMEGNSTLTRELLGVTAPEGIVVEKISGTLTASGTFASPPYTRVGANAAGRVAFQTEPIPGAYEYTLTFVPPLKASDEKVDVAIEAKLLRSHAMTRAEVEQRYAKDKFKNEYHTMSMAVPVDRITLEVHFPPEFERAKTDVIAFVARTEDEVASETERIRSFLTLTETSAILAVEEPKTAFRYAIFWEPAQ